MSHARACAGVVLCAVVIGCTATTSTTPSTSGGDGGVGTECSNGPAYGESFEFPLAPEEDRDGSLLPACRPRCAAVDATTRGGAYSVEAVPSGSCSADGERCIIGVQYRCACGLGRIDALICKCESRGWQCAVRARGRTACSCVDGGEDAATE